MALHWGKTLHSAYILSICQVNGMFQRKVKNISQSQYVKNSIYIMKGKSPARWKHILKTNNVWEFLEYNEKMAAPKA